MTNSLDISITSGDDEEFEGSSKGSSSTSILDQLKAIVHEEVKLPTIEIAVPNRDGISVLYSPNISSEDLKAWRKRSSNRKTGELQNIKFSCMVIAATCEGLLLGGEPVVDEDDDPVVFNSQTFADTVGVDKGQIIPEGIRLFFGVDAAIEGTALAILDKAGFGEDIEVEDPTNNS